MPKYVEPPTPLARRLRKLRIERRWSQTETARQMGVTYDVIQRAEHGLGLSLINAHIVASFWGLDDDVFFMPARGGDDSEEAVA